MRQNLVTFTTKTRKLYDCKDDRAMNRILTETTNLNQKLNWITLNSPARWLISIQICHSSKGSGVALGQKLQKFTYLLIVA